MQIEEMTKYEWRITIGIQRHWVTTAEKDMYLKCINKGDDLVALRDGTLFLGKNAQEIIHCNTLDESRQIEDYRKEGKFQCGAGNWHAAGSQCFCEYSYLPSPDDPNEIILVPKNKPLLNSGSDTQREKTASSYGEGRQLNGSLKSF